MIELGFDGRPDHTRVGHFTYGVRDDHWTWSDGLFELHGYRSGSVEATTDLLLRHKHPDDALRAFEVLEEAVAGGEPFSCYHRIIDTEGRVRYVLTVGRAGRGADGQVQEVTGFFVDLTAVRTGEVREAGAQSEGDVALVRLAERRSVVEQAKGMVMLARGCDEQEAFRVLRQSAATLGERLHDVASRIVVRAREQVLPEGDLRRDGVDELLGTGRRRPRR